MRKHNTISTLIKVISNLGYTRTRVRGEKRFRGGREGVTGGSWEGERRDFH